MATMVRAVAAETPPEVVQYATATSSANVFIGWLNSAPQPAPRPNKALILGEQFGIEYTADEVCIVHPQWSLIGSGRNLREAVQSLLLEAIDLAEAMAGDARAVLSPEAKRLRSFVLSVRLG